MHWVLLWVSCVFEVFFALSSNASNGFTRFWPSAITVLAAAGSVYTLSLALTEIDVSVGYPIWTGVGTVGSVIFGVILFGDRITRAKAACFASIIAGVVGLRLTVGGN